MRDRFGRSRPGVEGTVQRSPVPGVERTPQVMRDGALVHLPSPPAGYVYEYCEAGSGAREGYLLVPESDVNQPLQTYTTALDPKTKEVVWQLFPAGMRPHRGVHLGQPYYPIYEKRSRTLDVFALKKATGWSPSEKDLAARTLAQGRVVSERKLAHGRVSGGQEDGEDTGEEDSAAGEEDGAAGDTAGDEDGAAGDEESEGIDG